MLFATQLLSPSLPRRFRVLTSLYLLFLASFVAWSSIPDDEDVKTKRVLVWILLIFVLQLLVVEVRQIHVDGLVEYCRDKFQVFGILNLFLVVITILLHRIKDDWPKSYARLLGGTSFLAWFQLLYYARGITSIAALVQMIFAVVSDMSAFFILMCVFLVGLSHSLAVYDLAMNDGLEFIGTVEHFMNTIRDVAVMSATGEFDTADYDSAFHIFIAAIVIVVMTVIMLNLLIAVISETYERVRGIQTATINKARADLVNEMERTFLMWIPRIAPASFSVWLEEFMAPRYLIIFSPDDVHKRNSDGMTEVGKLRQQLTQQNSRLVSLQDQLSAWYDEQNQRSAELEKKLTEKLDTIAAALSNPTQPQVHEP